MLERLGNVLYWVATGVAVIALGFGIALAIQPNAYNPTGLVLFGAAIGLVVWLFGRACRYILAGR